MKLQISLEFMLVFSFVLAVFIFIFAVIANQRVLVVNQQTYSQVQSIAQEIAQQIDSAVAAGNGYQANIPIYGISGITIGGINVTDTGIVTVNAYLAKQKVTVLAYSDAKSVLAPSSGLSGNYVQIYNSYGLICIDTPCTAALGTSGDVLNLSVQSTNVAEFDGSSQIIIPQIAGVSTPVFTLSAWVYYNESDAGKQIYNLPGLESCSVDTGNMLSCAFPGSAVYNSLQFYPGTWYDLVSIDTGTACYVDISGVEENSPVPCLFGSSNGIGTIGSPGFNGLIANMQLYSTTLNGASLYAGGIAAAPSSTQYLAGWWPLSGDFNDYSIYDNNGYANGAIVFPTTGEVTARVSTIYGAPVQNAKVAFSTSMGYLNSNLTPFTVGATGYTGTVSAFVNQGVQSGIANVRATLFNGQEVSHLLTWLPMNQGQGREMFNFASNSTRQFTSTNASWSYPAYTATFNGKDSYIAAPISLSSSVPYTFALWFNAAKLSTSQSSCATGATMFDNGNTAGVGIGAGVSYNTIYVQYPGGCASIPSSIAIEPGRWYDLAIEFSPSPSYYSINAFINGQPAGSVAESSFSSSNPANYEDIGRAGSLNSFFNGSIANMQVYVSSTLTEAQLEDLYNMGISDLPEKGALLAWYPLDGDAEDYGPEEYNATIYGGLQFSKTSLTPLNLNSSSILAANLSSVNYIQVSNALSISPSSQMSAFAWVTPNLNYPPGAITAILQKEGSYGMSIGQFGSNDIPGEFSGYIGSSESCTSSPYPLIPHKLYFVGFTFNGSVVQNYVNGYPYCSYEYNGIIPTTSSVLAFGGPSDSDSYANDTLSNVQLYGKALSSSQVYTIYKGGIAGLPISNAQLSGWWLLDGNTTDYSSGHDNATSYGAVYTETYASTPQFVYSLSKGGMNFNGYMSCITSYTASPHRFLNSKSNFTIAAWVYPFEYAPSGSSETIYSEGSPGSTLSFFINSNGTLAESVYNYQASTRHNYTSTLHVPLDAWSFVAVTLSRGGANTGIVNMYLNTLNQTGTSQDESNPNTNYMGIGCNIGYLKGEPYLSMNGSIADLQTYNYTLNKTQLYRIYLGGIPQSESASMPLGVIR